MNVSKMITTARDAMTVRRVFAEPYEGDGVTVIPAAVVRGGAGGGAGKEGGRKEGEGAGFALSARPAGAYVVKDGTVTWQPAVDVNRIVTVAALGWVTAAWLIGRAICRP